MDKRKPIIWVINQFAGTLESGWGERHYYFSKYWISKGYDVKIISGSFNHMFRVNKQVSGLFEIENYDGVEFVWVKTPTYDPRSWKRFLSMLVFGLKVLFLPVRKLGPPSTIIVSSMPIFPILTAVWLKKIWKAKLIFEIRDIWPLTLQLLGNIPSWHPAVIFIGWFEKIGYRKSDAVVSLLPNARGHMELIAGKTVNFHYIPNGIDPQNTTMESLPSQLSNLIPKDKFVVGYAGTIGLANALEYFVEASLLLAGRDDICFIIVGDGYLKEELKEKTLGQKNIVFLPKIPKRQVQDLLTHFDICFVGRNDSPLFKHGVSANKYFDYMLASKPILDSNNLIKDPVELAKCGIIVKPDSAEAIRDGILEFYHLDQEKLESMGEAGYQYVTDFHNISKLADRYVTLFSDSSK